MKCLLVCALLICLLGTCCVAVDMAAKPGLEVSTPGVLKGLEGVFVLTEDVHADAVKDGLIREDIQAAVEARLRTLGVPVLTEKQWLATATGPELYVNMNTSPTANHTYALAISVEVHEKLAQARAPFSEVYSAGIWDRSMVAGSSASMLARHAKDEVLKMVDQFAADYLAANPKKPASNVNP